ncbi:MAG: aromatic-ring-hydroxylating dioxygenase subunit beta [Thermoleophilaceae bacterium]
MEAAAVQDRLLTRLAVEDFLYHEAALLDAWRLDDWFALFTEDATFVVPATDALEGNPAETLTIIDDDHLRLSWRVERLKSRHAHREFPYSRTRRVITNVRVTGIRDDELDVEAGVIVYRFRYGKGDPFVGSYRHTLVRDGDSFLFRRRRALLDMETLSPNGALSMIF